MSIPSGASIGSVVVEHRIASDGSGDTSLARQPALDRNVILRRLRRDMLGSERVVDRFQREARFGARLLHPNIVQVFDCFAYAGDRYLLLEHVDGSDLREVLDRARRIPPRVAAHLLRELCRGLQEVHARRLVHADLRPEHVRISRWGEVKLTGFAHTRELGQHGPTPEASNYRAPEAEREAPLGWSADVWSLGAILREMTTGDARAASRLVPPDRALARLLARCTQGDPARRPGIRQVAAALARRVGDPDASESRAEIAAWLWEARIFRPSSEASEEGTQVRAAPEPRRRGLVPRQVWIGAVAAAAGVGFALLLAGVERVSTSDPGTVAPPPAPVASAGPEVAEPAETPPVASAPQPANGAPALISFVAYPWAEIQIDGGESFLTPRAEAVSLAPGAHEVVFRHPSFGEERRALQVAAGQEEVVRHVFTPASLP